jgi:hypothetical protein
MEGRGIFYYVHKDGKASILIAYEDLTPFVEMAIKGQMA